MDKFKNVDVSFGEPDEDDMVDVTVKLDLDSSFDMVELAIGVLEGRASLEFEDIPKEDCLKVYHALVEFGTACYIASAVKVGKEVLKDVPGTEYYDASSD